MKTRHLLTACVLGLGLVLALLWLTSDAAIAKLAAIYHVSTAGTDDPSCGAAGFPCRTIPYAVDHRAQPGDTVVVAAGVYTEAFSLKAGVVISGSGAGATIVDGEHVRGPMVIADDGAIGGDTVLRGLTIRRGFTDTVGGGVYIDNGAAPTIENCVIRESVAGIEGGGLFILLSSPTLNNVQVLSNTAGWDGGGLSVLYASPALNGVQVLSNTADQDGGGVYVYGDGSPIFVGGRVAANRVITGCGGGIFVGDSSPTISGTQVVSNAAGWGGGGIYVEDSQATFTNVQVLSNTAQFGAGIQVWPVSAPAIIGGEVRGNVASDGGGGIHIAGDSSPSIDGVVVRGNQVLGVMYGGGGVYVTGGASPVIHGGQVLSNTAAGNGGGIYVYDGAQATISGTHVISNVARDGFGGGVAVDYEAAAAMTDVHVLSSTAGWNGGGVWVNQDSALTFIGGRVQGNEAVGDGGGIDVTFDSTALIEGVEVFGNRDSGWASGIYLHYLVTATVRSCTVADNANYGIRVMDDAGTITITQSTVYSNAVGGIYLASFSTLVEHTLVYSHTGFPRCGVCVTNGSPTLVDVTSRHNHYGIYVNGSSVHPIIRNSHLLSNTFGLYLQKGDATLGNAPGQGNNIYGNGYGVFNSVPHVTCIAAAYNYWGAAGGPDDDSGSVDACYPSGNTNDNDEGDDVNDGVWYGSWLNAPIGFGDRHVYLPLVLRD